MRTRDQFQEMRENEVDLNPAMRIFHVDQNSMNNLAARLQPLLDRNLNPARGRAQPRENPRVEPMRNEFNDE